MTDVELAIRLTADASDASKAMDEVGDSAKAMASEVDHAGDKAADATSKLTGVADGADAVDTKMGGATASLGALSGGLEAAGFEGAAGALGTLGTATDFAAGAGQGLALVLETEKAQLLLAKAASIGKTVADKAMAAGSKAAAAGQWLLNAALTANPLGAVVVLIVALIAGLVLAYKKSDEFRAIVDKAMGVAKAAIKTVVDVAQDVWDIIKKVAEKVPDMSGAFSLAGTLIGGYINLFLAPLKLVKEAVEWIIDHLKDIKLPSIDVNPFNGRTSSGSGSLGLPGGLPPKGPSDLYPRGININLPGAVLVGSEAEVARYIDRVLGDRLRRLALT
jgi:phage-related protein